MIFDEKFNLIIIDFGLCKTIKNLDTDEFIPYKGTRGTKAMMCLQMFEEGITFYWIDGIIFALWVLLFNLVTEKDC